MQNDPNQQPTPEPVQPQTATQRSFSSRTIEPIQAQPADLQSPAAPAPTPVQPPAQPEQAAAAPVQSPTPPAPVQSPTQPGPNNGQPADLSAQKLLEDYESDRDRHDLGKVMVIGSALMVIGGITLWPFISALLLYGPAFLAVYLSAPAIIGLLLLWLVTAVSGVLLVFRKELGRIAARIVAAVQLVFIVISTITSFGANLWLHLGSENPGRMTFYSIVLTLLTVVFYVWVFVFLGKQSVRNLFRP